MNGRICPECNVRTADGNCPQCGCRTIRDRRSDVIHDPMLGRVLDGRYRIDAVVGRGGMGAVYQGLQLSTQQVVAIKVIRAEQAEDIEAARRFHREARAASLLKHPHTIRVFDFGESETGELYMVLEFLAGRTLSKVMRAKGALPEARVAKIACEVAQSLAEAHAAGLAHRDLKPDNIMLVDSFGDPDFVKVLDFGIAKFLSSGHDVANVTRTGAVVGTPYYTAPEQARGKPPTPAVDVYSLGIIIYEALSATRPYDAPSPLDILVQHVRMPVPELPASYDVGGDTRDLMRRMLSKDPLERPSAAEAARTFERIRILCQAREVSGDWGALSSSSQAPARITAPSPTANGAGTDLNVRAITSDAIPVDPRSRPTSPEGMAVPQVVEPPAAGSGGFARRRGFRIGGAVAVALALAGAGTFLATRGPNPDASAAAVASDVALAPGAEDDASAVRAEDVRDAAVAQPPADGVAPPTPAPGAAAPDVRPASEVREAPVVRFASDPPGAQVLLGGRALCQTPCDAAVEGPQARRSFTFRLDGFPDAVVEAEPVPGTAVSARLERAAPPARKTPPAPAPARKAGGGGSKALPIED